LTNNCTTITIGQPLKPWQKTGLEWVSFFRGRDVVLAIDLTESVGFNDQGRVRLRQIVSDSLSKGDTVYVIPFANDVSPSKEIIKFTGNESEIEKILSIIPFQTDKKTSNTDIQKAEGFIYKNLAQINQCRMLENEAIKPQSIVWITDAPLNTKEPWIETPFDSPFRNPNSSETKERIDWLNALDRQERALAFDKYKLTVVDIPPTVQEICTPAPGGKETCLVTNYLINQLSLPLSLIFLFIIGDLIGTIFLIRYALQIKKPWKIKVELPLDESQNLTLKNGDKIAIGGGGINSVECTGDQIRGYLQRQGNRLFLIPPTHLNQGGEDQDHPLEFNGREITKKEIISNCIIRLNCPDRDYEITIRIEK
jgi:hypothetical protein